MRSNRDRRGANEILTINLKDGMPLVREAVLRANPAIAQLVKPLMQGLDLATLRALNARVQIDGEADEVVASDYLKSRGLLH